MSPLAGVVPEPAERVRSALRRCGRAVLHTGDSGPSRVALVHVDPAARTLVLGVDAPAQVDGMPPRFAGESARLSVLDEVVGSGPAAGVVRCFAEVTGAVVEPELSAQRSIAQRIVTELPDPALLRVGHGIRLLALRPAHTVLVDRAGAAAVDLDDLVTSGVDPFADIEGLWLDHLNDPQCPVLAGLARRLGARWMPAPPVLTAIDRFGLVLACGDPLTPKAHLRVPFRQPCVTAADLATQIRLLVGCPRTSNALRALREPAHGPERAPRD